MTPSPTLANCYSKLEDKRRPFLDRARECATLTLPFLMPPPGQFKLYTPFQGIGARGVNNLSAKLLLALLPPNSPFFRLMIEESEIASLDPGEELRAEIDEALSRLERMIMTEIECGAMRVGVFEALKHLIVTGNVLLYLSPQGGMRVFHLDSFVIRRDPVGHVLEIITLEKVDKQFLPESVRHQSLEQSGADHNSGDNSEDNTVSLFTRVTLEDNQWKVLQEANNLIIPGSEGTYPIDRSPWIPLRFIRIDGEDYGRGLVEEYLGDLKSLESLSKAIIEGSSIAAKVLFLVKPNSTTRERVIAEAPNGAVRSGNAEDVSVLQVQKYADFRVAKETIDHITQRLSYAFLLNSSIQRKGERVTAEEVRHMAGELEDTLGGVYSILAQEFQLPLINRLMHQMERTHKLPKLPKGMVKPMLVTGLEALGRGHDLMKLQSFVEDLSKHGQAIPELLMRLNSEELIKRLATARGLDTAGLLKSDEEMMSQQQMMQQTTP